MNKQFALVIVEIGTDCFLDIQNPVCYNESPIGYDDITISD